MVFGGTVLAKSVEGYYLKVGREHKQGPGRLRTTSVSLVDEVGIDSPLFSILGFSTDPNWSKEFKLHPDYSGISEQINHDSLLFRQQS